MTVDLSTDATRPDGRRSSGDLAERVGTTDADLRRALLRKLSGLRRAPFVVEELGIAGEARVDVATVDRHLSGFEIKSDRDSLRRLPAQVAVYSQVFDYVTLVASAGHLSRAASLIPDWWGVVEARQAPSGVVLARRVRGRLNRDVDPWYLTSLLWRDEVLGVLTDLGLDRGLRSKSGMQLREVLVEQVSTSTLRSSVRACLRLRRGWRPATP